MEQYIRVLNYYDEPLEPWEQTEVVEIVDDYYNFYDHYVDVRNVKTGYKQTHRKDEFDRQFQLYEPAPEPKNKIQLSLIRTGDYSVTFKAVNKDKEEVLIEVSLSDIKDIIESIASKNRLNLRGSIV